ncbi:MAG: hypothetical protein KKB31_07365 [Nanoarchaeota archaeon]|nr:hypothetical protein [Nanoarchaeota archaeon]
MANRDAPRGLVPHQTTQGGPPRIGTYNKDALAAAIYIGDAVILEADGNVAVYSTGGGNLLGVSAEYVTASTAKSNFKVYDDPFTLFRIQDDATGLTASTQSSVGNNADILATAGNQTTKLSKQELDISGHTAGVAQLRIVGLYNVPGNAWGSWSELLVTINEHVLLPLGRAGI